MIKESLAPGWPGIPARWTSGAKSGVGTANNTSSSVWFTISQGILNEIYYPHVDKACTRDFQLLITNGKDFFCEEKRDTQHEIQFLSSGVPAYKLINTCNHGNFRIEKEIIADPFRNSILQKIKFTPLKGSLSDYNIYVLLAPHIGNYGSGNTGWVGEYKGLPMLFAEREDASLALACSIHWKNASVGFVGTSDGWQDISQNKQMTWQYLRAENGNIALTAEVDTTGLSDSAEFVVSLGFGRKPNDAGQRSKASLVEGFDSSKEHYINEWKEWQKKLFNPATSRNSPLDYFRISTAVLRTHAAKRLPGGLIASLSIPWGFAKGDDDIGGYHLVWPRDLVETAGGLLAAKANDDAKKVLNYLVVTQESDGHWSQNMWLDGTSYWNALQMDETALPVLLVDLAWRKEGIRKKDIHQYWPMVKKAVSFIVKCGPVTHQDRWEENSGYSPFTLAVEISALLIGAEMAEFNHEPEFANFLRETADSWNESIERWTYVTDSIHCKKYNVDGHYIRIAPRLEADSCSTTDGKIILRNNEKENSVKSPFEIISPDALALVRFGLRAADDPRILNTVKVIDSVIKVDTPYGSCWYRYNHDGYGEYEDGRPYNGTGKGRPWPLLTGERAHYEIAAGNLKKAKQLQRAIESFANEGGMIPEQIWDSESIPEKKLFFGRPTGAAMPLVWAHAEYITLCRSIKEKKIFDTPPQTVERYIENQTEAKQIIWSFNDKITEINILKTLRIHLNQPARVRWSIDNWETFSDQNTIDSQIGVFYIDIPKEVIIHASGVIFTFYWMNEVRWENKNYKIYINKSK